MISQAPSTPTPTHGQSLAEAMLAISIATLNSDPSSADVLDDICSITARAFDADACAMRLLELAPGTEGERALALRASFGLDPERVAAARRLAVGEGLSGRAVEEGQTIAEEPGAPGAPNPEVARVAVPLRLRDEVVGAFLLERRSSWSPEECVSLEFLGRQAAGAVERIRLVREKLEAERLAAIGVSLSEVAHYIKNVLQAWTTAEYFIESGLKHGDLEKVRTGWDMARRSSKRIYNLVMNMLEYSRRTRFHFEEADLNALVAGLARELEDTAARRKIHLRVQMDELIPPLVMDANAIHDVLLNLVTNAMDAIPAGEEGDVVITSRLDLAGNCARLQVTDNGMGIPPELQPKMFNLFFTTKGSNGTGIGLAASQKMVREHGGNIYYETEPGAGTTFTVELPLKRVAPAAA